MQSTGQTSTQAVSFVSIQGSVMMNGMLANLRNVRDDMCVSGNSVPAAGPDRSAFRTRTGELYRETSRGQLRVAQGVCAHVGPLRSPRKHENPEGLAISRFRGNPQALLTQRGGATRRGGVESPQAGHCRRVRALPAPARARQ